MKPYVCQRSWAVRQCLPTLSANQNSTICVTSHEKRAGCFWAVPFPTHFNSSRHCFGRMGKNKNPAKGKNQHSSYNFKLSYLLLGSHFPQRSLSERRNSWWDLKQTKWRRVRAQWNEGALSMCLAKFIWTTNSKRLISFDVELFIKVAVTNVNK